MPYVGDFLIEDGVIKTYIGVGGDVVVPDCVKEVGESSFLRCNAVETIVLPEGVEIIQYAAFAYRTALISISMPRSLRIIGEGAFEGCTSLKKINIPEGVKQIDVAAFYSCENLEYIEIPKSLENYEDFLEEASLTAIRAPGIPLRNIPEKYKVHAVHGFTYYKEQDESIRAEYMDYVRANNEALCRRAEKCSMLLLFMMEEELIELECLEKMLAKAIEKKDFELTASLLDYQGKLMTAEKLQQRAEKEKEALDELWEF